MAEQEAVGATGETESQEKRTSNRLTLAQHLQAVTWLTQRREEACRIPRRNLAAMLADHLHHEVSVKNLEYIADAAGIRLHSEVPEINVLLQRLEDLEKHHRALCLEVAGLRVRILGGTPA